MVPRLFGLTLSSVSTHLLLWLSSHYSIRLVAVMYSDKTTKPSAGLNSSRPWAILPSHSFWGLASSMPTLYQATALHWGRISSSLIMNLLFRRNCRFYSSYIFLSQGKKVQILPEVSSLCTTHFSTIIGSCCVVFKIYNMRRLVAYRKRL